MGLFQYLDNWLNLFHQRSLAEHQTQELVRLCARLGLMVNHKKSELVPKQMFLGEILELKSLPAFATDERLIKVCGPITQVLQQQGLWFPTSPFNSHLPDDSSGTTSSEVAANRGNQSHSQRSLPALMGPRQESDSQISPLADVTNRLTPGVPFRPLTPQLTVYTVRR